MAPMPDVPPDLDETIDVDPGHWTYGGPTRCRLRLYRCPDGTPLAVVTELAENRGHSVSNAAEHVWRALALRLDTTRFVLVEHYGPESYEAGRKGETFDVVTIENGQPRWRRTSAGDLRELLPNDGHRP
jgi:hypothetical protein